MKAVVASVKRLRCMDEDDRICECGGRITVRWCEQSDLVKCPSCGRHYEVSLSSALPKFKDLARYNQ